MQRHVPALGRHACFPQHSSQSRRSPTSRRQGAAAATAGAREGTVPRSPLLLQNRPQTATTTGRTSSPAPRRSRAVTGSAPHATLPPHRRSGCPSSAGSAHPRRRRRFHPRRAADPVAALLQVPRLRRQGPQGQAAARRRARQRRSRRPSSPASPTTASWSAASSPPTPTRSCRRRRRKNPLSDAEKQILKRWIAAGAEYKAHWAFVAPQQAPLPKVKQADWPRNADRSLRPRAPGSGRAAAVAARPTATRSCAGCIST